MQGTAGAYSSMRAADATPHKEADPAAGYGQGGFSAQIRLLMDWRGRPLRVRMTRGSAMTTSKFRF